MSILYVLTKVALRIPDVLLTVADNAAVREEINEVINDIRNDFNRCFPIRFMFKMLRETMAVHAKGDFNPACAYQREKLSYPTWQSKLDEREEKYHCEEKYYCFFKIARNAELALTDSVFRRQPKEVYDNVHWRDVSTGPQPKS